VLPYLRPALIGSAAISFLMSFADFNTTLMLVGADAPLTVEMYGRMREGANARAQCGQLVLMLASALLALGSCARQEQRRRVRLKRPYGARELTQSRCAAPSIPFTRRSNMTRRSNPGGSAGSSSTVITPGGLRKDLRGQ